MIIDQLPEITIANDSDEIAIEQGTATKKINKGNFLQEVSADISTINTDLGTKATKAELGTYVRPNLLDNWYFGVGVINQRGQSSYSTAGYTIDRWRIVNSIVTDKSVTDKCINVKLGNGGSLRQRFLQPLSMTILANMTYTFSALIKVNSNSNSALELWLSNSGSEIINHIVTAPIGLWSLESWTFQTSADQSTAWVEFITGTTSASLLADFDLMAVKLELGDTQTLAHQEGGSWVLNEIPKPEEELMKCLRYLVVFPVNTSAGSPIGSGYVPSAAGTTATFFLPLPVPLAKNGTVTAQGNFYVYPPNSAAVLVTSINATAYAMLNGVIVSCSVGTPLAQGGGYILRTTANSTSMIISAEP